MAIPRIIVLTGIAGLALAPLVACGSDDGASTASSDVASTTETVDTVEENADVDSDDTVDDTSAPTGTSANGPVPTTEVVEPSEVHRGPGRMQLGLVDCVQFAMVAPVDADAARSLVPDGIEVLIDEAGTATFTQVSKTCGDMTLDEVSQGPGHFDTQWIAIGGPEEQRGYTEFPDHFVLPTDYLYPISFATDNDAVRQSVSEFGVPMEAATLEMEPLAPGEWSGSASGPDGDHSWRVDNTAASGMDVFFVHVLERADQDMDFRYDIECPSTVAWGPGPASLTSLVGSAVYEAFGPEILGEGYAVELTCDVAIDRTMQVEVIENVAYTETEQLDVYAPASGSDWPVVVYFHGGNVTGDPNWRKGVAEGAQLAGHGLVVYVPSWASLGPEGGSQDTVCAVAFAQSTAADYGGDADRVTLSGYSTGGFTAAIHTLIGDEPPLPSGDCLVDPEMALPGAVVAGGTPFFVVDAARAGAFADGPQWNTLTPEQLDAFDPYLALGRNPDVEFVLVVGKNDVGGGYLGEIPIAASNLEYHEALVDAGYDAELVLLDGGHEMAPGSAMFDAWVTAIAETADAVSET